jgi:hypothetical protein
MNDPFLAVDSDNSSFATLVGSSGDENFIVFADRNGADLELAKFHRSKLKCWDVLKGQSPSNGARELGGKYLVLFFEFF